MFYAKNVPGWERAMRIMLGVACIGFGILNWGGSALAVAVFMTGAMLALTGLFGFCPACALIGRKIDKGN